MDVCPLELKSGYPVPRGLSRYGLEPKGYGKVSSHGREPELQQRMQMPFSLLAESALFCANFAVAPAGLIGLACAILLAVTV